MHSFCSVSSNIPDPMSTPPPPYAVTGGGDNHLHNVNENHTRNQATLNSNRSPNRISSSTAASRSLQLPSRTDLSQLTATTGSSGVAIINDIVGNGVLGMLHKWVNYGKGWRLRWFVLQDGVLSYYKIHGPHKILLNRETEKGGRVIGEESFKWISRQIHKRAQSFSLHKHRTKPVGEIHLKVSSIRESRSDDKKFSIFSGTKRLHLKAETREDRIAWIEALQAVKDMFPRISNCELLAPVDNITVSTDKLRQRLLEEGLNEAAINDSELIMRNEFASLQNQLLLLKQKHWLLIDTLRQMETEKVDLENTVVDETQRQIEDADTSIAEKFSGDASGSDSDENHRADVAEDEDTEEEEEEEEEDNTYFDTRDFLSSNSFKSNGSDMGGDDDFDDHEIRYGVTNFQHVKRRKKLPDPIEKEKGVSLWSMIKDNIGKDLTKVCLPVYFNEPLSSLQKCYEDLEYSYLIDRAYAFGKKGDGLMRILCVAAFAVSAYASTEGRSCKPFNPLLGETYEAEFPDKGLRFVSEKVGHHPMIVACHCEGKGWKFWADSNLKSKFSGRSIQLDPVGPLTLEFDDGEVFQWNKVTTSIYNLILGKLYCDHYGTMRIQGNRNYSCKLKFKEQSILDRNPHQVQGIVEDRSGNTVATLFGKWDEIMRFVDGDHLSKGKKNLESVSGARVLWKRSKSPEFMTRYNFTSFAITLNELTPGLKEKLPPTDSRLRPDQRCLENGEFEKANAEKLRLEQRQRQARKMQERGWKPRWFEYEKESGAYRYVGGYWEARKNGIWDSCPDIFGHIHNTTD